MAGGTGRSKARVAWASLPRARRHAATAFFSALSLAALYYAGFGASPSSQRQLADEFALPGAEHFSAPPPSLVGGFRISNGGQLWPAFSPEKSSYRVYLDADAQAKTDLQNSLVPEVELEVEIGNLSLGHRLFINDVEARHAASIDTRVSKHKVALAKLALTREDGSPLYPYELVMIEVRDGATGLQLQDSYTLRVFRPSGTRAAPISSVVRRLVDPVKMVQTGDGVTMYAQTSTGVFQEPENPYAHVKLLDTELAVDLASGSCRTVPGPMQTPPLSATTGAVNMGLWSADREHILCYYPDYQAKDKANLMAQSVPSGAMGGQFGFGEGMGVGLRPNVLTNATWPLESGVRSVGLDLPEDVVFRPLAFRGELGGQVADVPTVVAWARESWPLEIQFLNASVGHCEPVGEWGAERFLCRTDETIPVGTTVEVLSVCGPCIEKADRHWTVRVVERGGQGPTVQPSETGPWVAWKASAPPPGTSYEWEVTVLKDGETEVFEMAMVYGNDPVAWMPEEQEKALMRSVGGALKHLVLLAIVALATMTIMSARVTVPLAAVLPTVSAALASLQFLALIGNQPGAPVLLSCLVEPWSWLIMPKSAQPQFLFCLACLVACLVAHAVAFYRHVAVNRSGSATNLPHSLYMGAWELRVLGFVALPLATSCCRLIWDSDVSLERLDTVEGYKITVVYDLLFALFAGMLLIAMAAIAKATWSRIGSWITDERVIAIELPAARDSLIFVDRMCSQLRTMPMSFGMTRWLGNWSSSPAWCVAPVVACIQEMEHFGAPDRTDGTQAWELVWPAGPWGDEATRDLDSARYRRKKKGGARSVRTEHHVKVSTKTGYKVNNRSLIAGVTILPWLDIAVPGTDLKALSSQMGSVPLRVHPGQLAGPLTAGRLAACFDWGTRWPWRWPAEFMLKLFFGVYLTFVDAGSHLWLHNLVILSAFALAVLAFFKRPYIHFIDNTALSFSMLVVGLGGIIRVAGSAPMLIREGILLLAVVTAIPLGIALGAAILASVVAVRCNDSDLHNVLPRCVVGWGTSGSSAPRVEKKESEDQTAPTRRRSGDYGLLLDDDIADGSGFGDADARGPALYNRDLNVRVTMDMQATGPMKGVVIFPAKSLIPIEHTRIQAPTGPAEAAVQLPDNGERVLVQIPASHLFMGGGPQPAVAGMASTDSICEYPSGEVTIPVAILVTEADGRLIYQQRKNNGGMTWKEATQSFFGPQEPGLCGEVEKIVNTFCEMRTQISGENNLAAPMVVVRVEGAALE